MTREKYLDYRKNKSNGNILYEFYREGFDAKKHDPFLTIEEFIESLNMWGAGVVFLPSVLSYFDCKFEVQKLSNKDGQIIKFI